MPHSQLSDRPAHDRASERDTTGDLLRLVALHAGLVAVPVAAVVALVGGLAVGWGVGIPVGLVIGIAAGVAVTAARLRDTDGRVAALLGARPATPEEHPRLHNLAENVAMAVGVAMPRLLLIDGASRNAVTWGDGRSAPCVALTTGLLDAADRIEVEAVLGRQLVVARDGSVDLLTVAAVLFDRIGALDGPVASLVHHAIDDRAVVEADLEGVRATCYPPGMVAALDVVRAGTTGLGSVPRALVGACLAAPGTDDGPFAVHPTLADRIDLLREI